MANTKISIIMSNYNCGKYIWRSIESIINQTYHNWEAIIVDDGSTDNSREVIAKYVQADKRIKPVLLDKNKGMCAGFNAALEKACGDYYARIDSDDYWEPEKLEKQLRYMESNPNCGASFTWVRVIDENENEVPSCSCENRDTTFNSQNRTRAQWLRTLYFEGCKVCHPTAMIRREAIEKVGKYNYIYKQIQDYDLWLRIVKHYDIYVIPEKLANYRWFVEDTPNASAYNEQVGMRARFELYLIMSGFHNDLSDELFVEAFKEEMVDKTSFTHNEVECERALFMYHRCAMHCEPLKIIGLCMMNKLYNRDETRTIMEEKYEISLKDYANWTTQNFFYDEPQISQVESQNDCLDDDTQTIAPKFGMKEFIKRVPIVNTAARKIYQGLKK